MKAFAKLNLGLWALGLREDGYHEVMTVLHLVDLWDEIGVEDAGELRVECDACPQGPDNIVWRAVQLLGKAKGAQLSPRVTIRKRIPLGGGLGGGSADAGAVLRLLGHDLAREELLGVAAEVGSDVAFFASGFRCAVATGRGERIEEQEARLRARALLFVPRRGVETPWAYSLLRARGRYVPQEKARAQLQGVRNALVSGNLDSLGRHVFNSFEEVIFPQRPDLAAAQEALLSAGARAVLLSGSGGVVYGLFPEDQELPNLPDMGGTWLSSRLI